MKQTYNESKGMRVVALNGERKLELDGMEVVPTSSRIGLPCYTYSPPLSNGAVAFKYLMGPDNNCYMWENDINLLLSKVFPPKDEDNIETPTLGDQLPVDG